METMAKKERSSYFDNQKFFLILLVVLGHGKEVVSGRWIDVLYVLVYLFHMPAMILIAGYFTRKQTTVKVGNLFCQYLFFQTLYIFFAGWLEAKPLQEIPIRYATPYWLLWFTVATILWKLVMPHFARIPKAAGLALAVVWALLAGFVGDVGDVLSISRVSVFFPFFVIGYYMEEKHLAAIRKIPRLVSVAVFVASFFLVWRVFKIPHGLLYGSVPYKWMDMTGLTGPRRRLTLMVWGFVLIIAFMALVPQRRIPFLSYMGTNTLPVYYLHGFPMVWMRIGGFMPALVAGGMRYRALFYAGLVCMTLVLASKPVAWLMKPFLNPIFYIKKLYGFLHRAKA